MVRKLPTQVPAAVSRLIDSSLIQTPPPWYNAVLANPPPVLPPRQVTPRSRPGASAKTYPDLPPHYTAGASSAMAHSGATGHHQAKFLRQPKVRPAPIVYPADRVRRQFFADFPFEALRPVSLVEASNIAAEHPVNGKEWTSLAQRGGYPTVEDTVVFTLNLHDNHGLSMSAAYLRATDEFVKLRATHEVATLAAAAEARAYGAVFKRDEFTRTFELEEPLLEAHVAEPVVSKSRKNKHSTWTSTYAPERVPRGDFTSGRAYVQKWNLPRPAEVTGAVAAEGDLVSAIGAQENVAEQTPKEDEVDDIELMNAILGVPPTTPTA